MPRVPEYNSGNFAVAPTNGSGARVDNPFNSSQFNTEADQLQKFGVVVEGAGQTAANIDTDEQNVANQVRVSDAMNQARQHALDLTYNPENGYANLKGSAALQRPDGQALPDEYSQKLGTGLSQINSDLSNDAQRRMFQLQAGELATNFHGDVEKHMLGEFRDYHMSVANGQGELAVQDATLNWNNPIKIDQAINGVPDPAHPDDPGARQGGLKQSIYQKAIISGMSANEATAAMNETESKVHSSVIESALVNNNPTYAQSYFQSNKGQMTGNDILAVQGKLNHQLDSSTALGAVNATNTKYNSAFAPTDMDRLHSIVAGTESNGQRFGADGKILQGPYIPGQGTAKGEMQVMDATNLDPGYGVKPAQDNSPEERARVGRDYIDAMLKRYGNVPQALAAYNAGPGEVDSALAKAKTSGQPWETFLPKQTQDYVSTGAQRFGAGVGAPTLPTEQEFVTDAIGRLGDSPRVEQVQMTREQAEAQYKLLTDSRKQQGDQALAQAQKELIANNGNFAALNPNTVSNLSRYDAGKYDDALKFAKAIAGGENMTNMEAYATAVTYPGDLAKMSDPDFVQFLKTNFSSRDAEKIATLRANVIDGKNNTGPDAINSSAVNTELKNRLLSIGINPTPKNTDLQGKQRIGTVQKFVRDSIYDQQQQLGRKMNPEEVATHIDDLFSKSVDLPGTLWGTNTKNMLSMKIGDVPSAAVTNIKAAFKQHGINNPSETDILEAYWNWKNKNGG